MINKCLFMLILVIYPIACTENHEQTGNPPLPMPLAEDKTPPPSPAEIIEIINRVNDHWQSMNEHGDASPDFGGLSHFQTRNTLKINIGYLRFKT